MIAGALALAVVATSPCTSGLSRVEARARVDRARELLERQHEAYRAWQAAWVTGMAAAVVGQAGAADATPERGRRAVLLVGALKAAVGLVAVVTMPEPDLAPWSGDVCVQVRAAEAALVELAAAQAASTRAWRHAGSVLLNVGATLFVGLVYDEWALAVTSGLIGVAVGQAILRTRPDGAVQPALGVAVGPLGAALVWRF